MYASMAIVNAANLYQEMRRSVEEGVQTDFDTTSDEDEESFRKHALHRAQRFIGSFESDTDAQEELDDSPPIPCETVGPTYATPLPAFALTARPSNLTTIVFVDKTLLTVTASPIDPDNDENSKTEDTVISRRDIFKVLPSEERFLPQYEAGVDIRSVNDDKVEFGETSESSEASESHQNLYEDHGYGNAQKIGGKYDEEYETDSSHSKEWNELEARHKRWLFGLFGSNEDVKPVNASRPEDVKSISEKPESRK